MAVLESKTGAGTVPPRAIIGILGLLAAFAPLATDMYLPGFHLMAEYFGVPEGGIEVSLSVFFLGLSVGQAIYGPLIDRFGRRGPLLAGIGLFVAATALCLLTADIHTFVALRFLQAIGGCAGMVIGRAIVSDLFDARESARAFSLLMTVMTLAPIVAPILGGFIITHIGWQAVFVVIMAFGLLCAALVWFFLPETLRPERVATRSFGGIMRVWLSLVTNRRFVAPALVAGFSIAAMFSYITGSPFVFITLHGVSAQTYGWLFALIACSLIVSAQVNRLGLRRKSPQFLLGAGLVLNLLAGLGTVLAVATGSLIALLVPLWLAVGSLGLIGPNAAALSMAASGRYAGNGSSLIGVLQFGLASIISSFVAAAQNGTAYPMALGIAGCGILATALWFTAGGFTRPWEK